MILIVILGIIFLAFMWLDIEPDLLNTGEIILWYNWYERGVKVRKYFILPKKKN